MPALLREAGWSVTTHSEIYAARDERVPDAEWLELCGRRELVALTADRKFHRRPDELAALAEHRARVFALVGAGLRAVEQVARLERHRNQIFEACQEPGPFLYTVRADGIVRIFPS